MIEVTSTLICTTQSGCGKREGWKEDLDQEDLWVCVVCSRPSHLGLDTWLRDNGFYDIGEENE